MQRLSSIAALLFLTTAMAVAQTTPASPNGMKGMSAKTEKPAASQPTQEMGTMAGMPGPAESQPGETMGGMPSTSTSQGMEMAPEPAHGAEESSESSANGGRIMWVFFVLNAGIIAAAAFLKSKRAFVKSPGEVKL